MGHISPNRMIEAYQKIYQMREALEHARDKLALYREAHGAEYVGGVEYTQLVREINAAVAVASTVLPY